MSIISVQNMVKSYGPVRAVDGVCFTVEKGEIFGLLGPNGAGKTTIVESLVGLRKPDSGELSVLGVNPWGAPVSLKERVGVQLQSTALFPRIQTEEAVRLFASFYEKTLEPVALLDRVGLAHKRRATVRHLSGGEQQRLALALALVHDPEVIFLDEVSAGLDPIGRRGMWELIRGLRGQGKTILLTTHFMDEAEALCDRVLFIRRGRMVTTGVPRELITDRRAANLDDLYVALMGGGAS